MLKEIDFVDDRSIFLKNLNYADWKINKLIFGGKYYNILYDIMFFPGRLHNIGIFFSMILLYIFCQEDQEIFNFFNFL